MSGHTPVAMSWSAARSTLTATPCRCMIDRFRSIRPWVWLGSGERFRVQLMYSARRSSKRHWSTSVLVGSVIGPPGTDAAERSTPQVPRPCVADVWGGEVPLQAGSLAYDPPPPCVRARGSGAGVLWGLGRGSGGADQPLDHLHVLGVSSLS